jgi:hypothetical protein
MPFLQAKWISGILLGTALLLGLGERTVRFGTAARLPDCPDPGIFVEPDTTTTAQMRVIEPPPDVDPEMVRPTETDCGTAAAGASSEEVKQVQGATRLLRHSR